MSIKTCATCGNLPFCTAGQHRVARAVTDPCIDWVNEYDELAQRVINRFCKKSIEAVPNGMVS